MNPFLLLTCLVHDIIDIQYALGPVAQKIIVSQVRAIYGITRT